MLNHSSKNKGVELQACKWKVGDVFLFSLPDYAMWIGYSLLDDMMRDL